MSGEDCNPMLSTMRTPDDDCNPKLTKEGFQTGTELAAWSCDVLQGIQRLAHCLRHYPAGTEKADFIDDLAELAFKPIVCKAQAYFLKDAAGVVPLTPEGFHMVKEYRKRKPRLASAVAQPNVPSEVGEEDEEADDEEEEDEEKQVETDMKAFVEELREGNKRQRQE